MFLTKMYIKLLPLFLVYLVLIINPSLTLQHQKLPEDATLNFTALGRKCGHTVEEHDVITEDGYILKLFHIRGDINKPIFLMHGIIDSADTFIVRGNDSLTITLAQNGYDVWAGNARATPYSRRHKKLDPDSKAFWDFSFHEIGYYDLPAMIDYILNINGGTRLLAIAHSLGNTVFYVLGSTRPEYNDKIKILVALGPVCYLDNLRPPLNLLPETGPMLNSLLEALNTEELFAKSLRTFIQSLCMTSDASKRFCTHMFQELAGHDDIEFKSDFFAVLIGHYPTSTSRKNAVHAMQIARSNRFAHFDYGERNMQEYKSRMPPDYVLDRVTMKVALYTGRNDRVTPLKNVDRLAKQLPNVVEYKIMDRKKFNHIDHVWGKHMNIYLFPYLLRLLDKYI